MKQIPKGMYYDCKNAVQRHAIDSLIRMLVKFNIKSASMDRRYVVTGRGISLKVNGKVVPYAQGVTYNVDAGIRDLTWNGSDD
jgi:hypothetical protein